MTWTIETLGKFFESKMSNPFQYEQLTKQDPTGRLWAGMRKAEADYRKAHAEYHTLIPVEISPDPARLAEVESIMNMTLAVRDACKTGLEQACALLTGHQEPSCRAITDRAQYLRRSRQGGDAASLDALCASLEQIATQAGV